MIEKQCIFQRYIVVAFCIYLSNVAFASEADALDSSTGIESLLLKRRGTKAKTSQNSAYLVGRLYLMLLFMRLWKIALVEIHVLPHHRSPDEFKNEFKRALFLSGYNIACDGGWPFEAFEYFSGQGAVTGGDY
uniref:DDE_Tnp_IS240 domain-containing protein n=1 Tax=Haemonchus placei TaxID=6290 RepID=A0A0N4VZ58_HAEPC